MVLKNLATMSGLSVLRSAVQLGINILLAFYIGPQDYGLVVFSTPFILLMNMLTDMGMSSALVRMRDLDRETTGAAFSLLLTVGSTLALLLILAAPLIAYNVGMPKLPLVLAGMAISGALGVGAIVPRGILERKLAYPRIALVESGAVLASAAIAISMAVLGFGVWSLVALNIAINGIRLFFFLRMAWGDISWSIDWAKCRPMISFGTWVLLSNLTNFLARNFDNLLVGTVLGAASVGIYGMAYQFMMIPMIAITWPASGVLLATLTRNGVTTRDASRIVTATVGITASLTFPLMIGIALIFPVLAQYMSNKWLGIGTIVAWLAPLGAVQSISAYNGTLLLVSGRAKAQFFLGLLNTGITIVACVLGIQWGLIGMVKALVVCGYFVAIGYIVLIVRLAHLGWSDMKAAVLPPVCACTLAFVALILLRPILTQKLELYVLPTVFGGAVLLVYALFRERLLSWVTELRKKSDVPALESEAAATI